MTSDEDYAEAVLYKLIFTAMTLVVIGISIGYWVAPQQADCTEPQYDVNRVVKMHEEARQCAVELEEARDNVLVCGRLLKRALE